MIKDDFGAFGWRIGTLCYLTKGMANEITPVFSASKFLIVINCLISLSLFSIHGLMLSVLVEIWKILKTDSSVYYCSRFSDCSYHFQGFLVSELLYQWIKFQIQQR